jgi:hemerythrin-like metal-binding protein
MTLFEWTADLELKIPQIDDQHKELVKLINSLYESIQEGHASETVDITLNRLLQYVEVHFETEELAMQKRYYPDYKNHLSLHEEFRTKVLDLKKEQLQGKEIATFELLNFLADWLRNHIAHQDALFGKFVHDTERSDLT